MTKTIQAQSKKLAKYIVISSIVLNVVAVAIVAGIVLTGRSSQVLFAVTHATLVADKMNDFNHYVNEYPKEVK